ncbi:MAG: hypothetical protein C5B50_17680 [Verrucomicrobia bacterium]|nr:MAG: hypothetical protein C5B50_17680 [Verrucomicrobiota bacterium]
MGGRNQLNVSLEDSIITLAANAMEHTHPNRTTSPRLDFLDTHPLIRQLEVYQSLTPDWFGARCLDLATTCSHSNAAEKKYRTSISWFQSSGTLMGLFSGIGF